MARSQACTQLAQTTEPRARVRPGGGNGHEAAQVSTRAGDELREGIQLLRLDADALAREVHLDQVRPWLVLADGEEMLRAPAGLERLDHVGGLEDAACLVPLHAAEEVPG